MVASFIHVLTYLLYFPENKSHLTWL